MTWPTRLPTVRARGSWSHSQPCRLLIIDDFGMRKLPLTAAEDLLEIIMPALRARSTLLTSNRPVETGGSC